MPDKFGVPWRLFSRQLSALDGEGSVVGYNAVYRDGMVRRWWSGDYLAVDVSTSQTSSVSHARTARVQGCPILVVSVESQKTVIAARIWSIGSNVGSISVEYTKEAEPRHWEFFEELTKAIGIDVHAAPIEHAQLPNGLP